MKDELKDLKTKVYLPSSYEAVATRFHQLVLYDLTEDTKDAFFGENTL